MWVKVLEHHTQDEGVRPTSDARHGQWHRRCLQAAAHAPTQLEVRSDTASDAAIIFTVPLVGLAVHPFEMAPHSGSGATPGADMGRRRDTERAGARPQPCARFEWARPSGRNNTLVPMQCHVLCPSAEARDRLVAAVRVLIVEAEAVAAAADGEAEEPLMDDDAAVTAVGWANHEDTVVVRTAACSVALVFWRVAWA